MSHTNRPPRLAPGPDEPFDVNVDDASFEKLAQWRELYGDIVNVTPRVRKSQALVLNNPEHVKHVLIGNHRNYAKGVGFERVKMLLGNGIIVSDGDFWRSQRRMIQPVFHRKIIASQAAMMQACNEVKLHDWQAKAASGTVIDITTEMSSLALEVILRSLFSDDLDELIEREGANPFSMLVEDVTRDLKMAMRFRALTRHVADVMARRRAEKRIEHDFLSLLMETRDKDTLQPMSDKALIDEVMTIIVAGHETTAGTLNWAWYLLSQDERVEQLVHAEVDSLGRSSQFDDLGALSYTRQVIDETLRLYPPVWLFSRKAIAEDELPHESGAIRVPAGADIFLCPYLLHRDARYWQDPEAFLPERFDEQNSKQRNRHAYYPFSLGSRRCIGEFFSMVDMQLHLGLLAQHIRLKHVPGEPVMIEPHINLRSRHSIMMLPVAR
ncbi:cytochrome P450 [Granulosicoccus antarcticus]|uniref:Pentalenene oxygenase n=1 Tax=Granulosicoccus antarcticus IMCC3135 TaxID=1192854 RepID=A0A2Z2NQ35_9GAMM|nr:cytochrome P450 [Granulosicoccus antarcticus]ASJ72575.1 Pentalenene oxygenase [Granulosicoccus antarcticus IMCC3135]